MRHAVRHLPEEKQDRFMEIWNNASSQQREFIMCYGQYHNMRKLAEDEDNRVTVKYQTIRTWDTKSLIEASDLLRETKYIQMQDGFEEMAPMVAKRLREIIHEGSERQSTEAIKLFMDYYSKNITENDNSDNTININFIE